MTRQDRSSFIQKEKVVVLNRSDMWLLWTCGSGRRLVIHHHWTLVYLFLPDQLSSTSSPERLRKGGSGGVWRHAGGHSQRSVRPGTLWTRCLDCERQLESCRWKHRRLRSTETRSSLAVSCRSQPAGRGATPHVASWWRHRSQFLVSGICLPFRQCDRATTNCLWQTSVWDMSWSFDSSRLCGVVCFPRLMLF